MDKGTVSNLISAAVLLVGLLLPDGEGPAFLLTVGMFAFSGGVTNALAVKMLFDRIPGLIGSGVIPSRFKEIRLQIKRLILQHFFSEEYLEEFFKKNAGQIDWRRYFDSENGGLVRSFIDTHWEKFTAQDKLRPLISSQVDKIMESTFGGLLQMVGKDAVEGVIGDFVDSFVAEMKVHVLEASSRLEWNAETIAAHVDHSKIISDLREKVNVLLDQKLEQLDATQVKRMLESVIRKHLGWLIVWGNVFGGLLGAAAHFVR